MKRLALVAVWCVILTGLAFASRPSFPFETQEIKPLPASRMGWHPQFEKNGDYGESWFSLVQADNGGVLFAMVTITNLGLKTYDGIVDMHYYDPSGKAHYLHKELRREHVTASTKGMDTTVGPARVWGERGTYNLTVNDPEMSITLETKAWLPPVMFGDGAVRFDENKSSEWFLGITVPYGRTSGEVKIGDKSFNLAGFVYSDHGYATIKMPDFVSQWRTLRVYKGKHAIVLHDMLFTKKFGEKRHSFGLFTVDGKTMLPIRELEFTPTAQRKHASGYDVPTSYTVSFKAGDYSVSGKVAEGRFLDGLDVLGQVSWPVRVLIKAFYANPFMFRSQMNYELTVTGPEGAAETLTGRTVVESNVF